MRLLVKRADNLVNELRFSRGPIYIGRQIGSQIFLPDRAVSRQHTVLYTSTEGKWIVEDLDSANKTYLNNEVIHKSEVNDGDTLTIADFIIEVHIDPMDEQVTSASLDDTLHATLHEPQIVLRNLDSSEAPLIRMQAKRAKDFSYASALILSCDSLEKILQVIIDLLVKQFGPYNCWASLRKTTSGSMEVAKGKQAGGHNVKLEGLPLEYRVSEAVKNHNYILIPRMPSHLENNQMHSAMVVPIMCDGGCYGVIYVDNSLAHEHYGLNDLDYLILMSLVIGGHIKSLPK